MLAAANNVLILIGPEGGFSHTEAEAAQRAGAQPISLGSRILRTETAALVVLSVLNYFNRLKRRVQALGRFMNRAIISDVSAE